MSQAFYPRTSSAAGGKTLNVLISTTAGGTLAATAGGRGVTLTKVAAKTGRYKLAFTKRWRKFVGCAVTIGGLTDAATTAAKATGWKVRNINVPATGNYIEIQFTNALADAELEDAMSAWVTVELSDSSV